MNPLNWQPRTSIPGYYTLEEMLAAFGMRSRQNFYQSGLRDVIPVFRPGDPPPEGSSR